MMLGHLIILNRTSKGIIYKIFNRCWLRKFKTFKHRLIKNESKKGNIKIEELYIYYI